MSPLSTAEITCLELNNSQLEQHGPVGYKNVEVGDEETNSWRERHTFNVNSTSCALRRARGDPLGSLLLSSDDN